MRWLKRGLQSIFRSIGSSLSPLGRVFVRLLILPIYGLIVSIKLRIHRLALPARGFLLFLLTNRYLLHASIAGIAVITIVTNLQTRQAHAQDVGQSSLLFALATNQQSEVIEERAQAETFVQDTHYLSSATLMGVPHVDFDYTDAEDAPQSSPSIPGTITVPPYEVPNEGLKAPRTHTETYIVQADDTISSIAHRFGVNVGTILWNNDLTERQYIRPGDKLVIPPVSGLIVTVKKGDTLQKIADTTNADAQEIASYNNLVINDTLTVGKQLIVPGGQLLAQAETVPHPLASRAVPRTTPTPKPIAAEPISGSGEEISPTESPTTPIDTDTSGVPRPPNADASKVAANRFVWPTSGHTITQYYGWKHTGIDIDGDYSSPLYAAADGVVEKAGWNSGGYGLMIFIDHPNGLKTRYGHASKLFVKPGENVKKGQVIAMMGTTGRSTGTHLHFEVYVNGARTNPLGYIK